ncbi:hypothetical protein [Bartonella sp. MM73XJBT]|nr:hypothetical protein [Bartonella sp. MM73XJBT]
MSDLIFGMLLSFGISSSPRVLKNNGLLGERVILGGASWTFLRYHLRLST